MHLIALVEARDHVCCRYRLTAFRPFLESAGHTLELCPLPRRWWARLYLLRRLQGATIILQRRLLPAWEVALLRRVARHLIFDFDDAVFLRDSYASKGLHHAGRLRRFAAVVRASDAIVAGNRFLADQACRWTLSRQVYVIPTCVDPACYRPRTTTNPGPGLNLVWVGSSSTLKGLEAIAPLLESIGRQVPGLRLKLISDRFFSLDHLPIDQCRWQEATEAREIAAGDVGISWIPDDLWSRGKCGLKVLQYMAAGLPVVANPVGVHPEIIQQGHTGYLAQTEREWIDALTRLAQDTSLRLAMGQKARERLESEYSVEAGATRWLGLLDRLSVFSVQCSVFSKNKPSGIH